MNIEELTDEQIHLMATVATEYEVNVLGGDDSYDIGLIRNGIDMLYKISDMESPEIIICPSPMAMAIESELKPGETIDYLGNGYDSGWTAFYDYFERIGVEYDEEFNFTVWKNFILKSGVFATVLCENVAFVCIRPNKVSTNINGDLHCVDGPAIAWRDGYREYALNGVWVDEHIVMTPAEKLDPQLVLKEKNAEVRREMVRKIGVERLILKLGAKVIDRQGDYELLDLNLGENNYRPYLKMLNPSIKTWHVEGVHPTCRTVQEAINWRKYGDKNRTWEPEVLT